MHHLGVLRLGVPYRRYDTKLHDGQTAPFIQISRHLALTFRLGVTRVEWLRLVQFPNGTLQVGSHLCLECFQRHILASAAYQQPVIVDVVDNPALVNAICALAIGKRSTDVNVL